MVMLRNMNAVCPECGDNFKLFRASQAEPIVELCGPCAVKRTTEIFRRHRRTEQLKFGFATEYEVVSRF